MDTTTRKKPAKRSTASKVAAKPPVVATAPVRTVAASRGPDDATESPMGTAHRVAKKPKRVHGTFSMPKADHARIAKLKDTAKRTGLKAKKNELFRLGLQLLQARSASELHDLILKLRRPEKKRTKLSRE